ncbi:MAG: hypothetical protein KC561_05570, partial [Myxococcales bacterium]|nr:hypothetical protein [Myxococcales bacterium]
SYTFSEYDTFANSYGSMPPEADIQAFVGAVVSSPVGQLALPAPGPSTQDPMSNQPGAVPTVPSTVPPQGSSTPPVGTPAGK